MNVFVYTLRGTAARDQTWEVNGTVEAEDMRVASNSAFRDAFIQLTRGKAVFGKPGIGCQGPYRFRALHIEEWPDPQPGSKFEWRHGDLVFGGGGTGEPLLSPEDIKRLSKGKH